VNPRLGFASHDSDSRDTRSLQGSNLYLPRDVRLRFQCRQDIHIADKRTGNLGMPACDESRVVSDPKSVASVCKSLCKNEGSSARPLNIRKKMKTWVIYTGKIGQI